MNTVFNCSIERTRNFVYSALGVSDDFSKGDGILIGANLLGIAVERAAGATVRAASIAAGNVPKPDRCAIVIEAEDITVDKMAGDDTIGKGVKMWYSADDSVVVSALSEVDAAGACYECGYTLEASDDVNDTVRIAFDGRGTVSQAGTG